MITPKTIITPKTDPDHPIVGHFFHAGGPNNELLTYYCHAYDPSCGFWMTSLKDLSQKNVSERAIDRTYHKVTEWPEGAGFSRIKLNIKAQEIRSYRDFKMTFDQEILRE